MNRSERRSAGIKGNPAQDIKKALMKQEFEKDLLRIRLEAMNYATNRVTAAFIIALGEEFKFGEKRLSRVLDSVNETFKAIEDGTVDVDDLPEFAKNYGITLEGGKLYGNR